VESGRTYYIKAAASSQADVPLSEKTGSYSLTITTVGS
jgi:hypothetical protein